MSLEAELEKKHISKKQLSPADISKFPAEKAEKIIQKSLEQRPAKKSSSESEVSFQEIDHLIDETKDELSRVFNENLADKNIQVAEGKRMGIQKMKKLSPLPQQKVTADPNQEIALKFTLKKELPLPIEGITFRPSKEDPTKKEPFIIGSYHVRKQIGSGGYGKVYETSDTILNRTGVMKIMAPEEAPDEFALENFFKEIQIIANNGDPHIVSVFDAGCFVNPNTGQLNYFLVMEKCEGGNLLAKKARISKLAPEKKLDFLEKKLLPLFESLSRVHERGFIHGDIKPQNVLLKKDELMLADFGLSNLASQEMESDTIIGTPIYMAPEYANGMPRNAAMDWYSTAVMLYELFTGESFFSESELQTKTLPMTDEREIELEPQEQTEAQNEMPDPEKSDARKIVLKLWQMYQEGTMGEERSQTIWEALRAVLPLKTSQVIFKMLQPRPEQRISPDLVIQAFVKALRMDRNDLAKQKVISTIS